MTFFSCFVSKDSLTKVGLPSSGLCGRWEMILVSQKQLLSSTAGSSRCFKKTLSHQTYKKAWRGCSSTLCEPAPNTGSRGRNPQPLHARVSSAF